MAVGLNLDGLESVVRRRRGHLKGWALGLGRGLLRRLLREGR
jgi:hypothetical protein